MKKSILPILLIAPMIFSCGQSSTSEVNPESLDSSIPSSEISSSQTIERGIPAFSKSAYSYDKNAIEDLELPVELNGVNIFAAYFDGYKLNALQYSYDSPNKVMLIKADFMASAEKGEHELVVYFDDEIEPITLTITVMNSVKTSFDTATKKYAFGKTGDLKYDCSFSTATVKKLEKDGLEIPSSLYSASNNIFTLKEGLTKSLCVSHNYSIIIHIPN